MTVRSILGALRDSSTVPLSSIPRAYREAVAEQQIIGWDNFFRGLWIIQWPDQLKQERYWNKYFFRLPERAITLGDRVASLVGAQCGYISVGSCYCRGRDGCAVVF